MKIGYLFPIAIIVAAVVLLVWFIIGGYATSGDCGCLRIGWMND
ncbi:YoaK family small membrane protein [Dryocola clanedunensis]